MYHLLVWLHILAAMTWIGGAMFLVVVLAPALRRPECRDVAGFLLRITGQRLRMVGWVCLGTLIATGTILLSYHGVRATDLVNMAFYHTAFGQTVGLKLLLVAIILVMSLVHDLWIGPRARDLMLAAPQSKEALTARKQASWMGRVSLLLGLAVLLLAVFIVRGRPF